MTGGRIWRKNADTNGTWTAFVLYVSCSAVSIRQSVRTSTYSLPMCTDMASLLKHTNINKKSAEYSSKQCPTSVGQNIEIRGKFQSVLIIRESQDYNICVKITHTHKNSFLGARKNCEKRLSASSYLSVHPHGKTRLPLDGILWNSIYEHFIKNLSKKFKFH